MRRTALSAFFAFALPAQDTPITLTDVQIRIVPADARGMSTFRSFQPLEAATGVCGA